MDGPEEKGGGIKRNRDIQHVEIKQKIGTKSINGLGGLGLALYEFHRATF